MEQLCKCGCNELTKSKNEYLNGHNWHHESQLKIKNGQIICNSCKKSKLLSEFSSKEKIRKSDNSIYIIYNKICKNCRNASAKTYRQNNPNNINNIIRDKFHYIKNRYPKSDITKQYLIELFNKQNGLCYISGNPLIQSPKDIQPTIYLKPLDINLGYMKNNLIWTAINSRHEKLCNCGCGLITKSLNYISGHKFLHEQQQGTKICTSCKKNLPIEKYRLCNQKDRKTLKTYSHYPSKCQDCENNYYREQSRWKAKNDIEYCIRKRLTRYKNNNLLFDLDAPYLINLYYQQNAKCYYTNAELDYRTVEMKDFHKSLSLDRLTPDKGYVKGNVVWTTMFINAMKSSSTESEFYDLMKQILKNKNLL